MARHLSHAAGGRRKFPCLYCVDEKFSNGEKWTAHMITHLQSKHRWVRCTSCKIRKDWAHRSEFNRDETHQCRVDKKEYTIIDVIPTLRYLVAFGQELLGVDRKCWPEEYIPPEPEVNIQPLGETEMLENLDSNNWEDRYPVEEGKPSCRGHVGVFFPAPDHATFHDETGQEMWRIPAIHKASGRPAYLTMPKKLGSPGLVFRDHQEFSPVPTTPDVDDLDWTVKDTTRQVVQVEAVLFKPE